MTADLIYADTSALVRCFFADEVDHEQLRDLLLNGTVPVVTSELAQVEFASAAAAAARAGRIETADPVVARFDAECRDDGAFTLLSLARAGLCATAASLVRRHRLRAMDAIHLATALTQATELAAGGSVEFVTRDRNQGAAAAAEGFQVG